VSLAHLIRIMYNICKVCVLLEKAKLVREISDGKNEILWSQNLVRELERDFTFSLTKYPSLIFIFLVVVVQTLATKK